MGISRKRASRATSWVLSAIEGVFIVGVGASSGCAGPTTPLGAVWDLRPQWDSRLAPGIAEVEAEADEAELDNATDESDAPAPSRGIASILGFGSGLDPRIQFEPPRQWLHGSHSLKVIVSDPKGAPELSGVQIRYHGHDVTRSFLMQAKVTRLESKLMVEVPFIRLSPSNEHLIEVGYVDPRSGRHAVSRLKAPVCRAFARKKIQNLDEFHPEVGVTQTIESVSSQMGFNPAFTAALIAQESAFNPRSVSLSRALGLTQVTSVAEEEVTGAFPHWPRFPGINDIPAPLLKWRVMQGDINAQNEWRLNPERSIRGGLAYARKLADRWQDSEGFSKVGWGGSGGAEIASTKLILASYNSGYTRVLQAVNRFGATWLMAPELKEARKYVNRIFSYCDAFERAATEETERARAAHDGLPDKPTGARPLSPALIQRVMNENET